MEAVPQPPTLDAELLRGQQQDELLAQVGRENCTLGHFVGACD